MSSSNFGRFASLNETYTTSEEITREMMKKANEESRERRIARLSPEVEMMKAKAKAKAKAVEEGGPVGLVWSIFGDLNTHVMAESVDGEFLADVVDQLLDTLKPQERFVLEHRYHFNGAPPMTYKAIGLICPRLREWDYEKKRAAAIIKYEDAVLGLSNTRVQQIEWKALRLLRHPSRSQRLKKFLITRTEVSVP